MEGFASALAEDEESELGKYSKVIIDSTKLLPDGK